MSWGALALLLAAQQPGTDARPPPGLVAERALENSTFVPVSAAAESALAEGDAPALLFLADPARPEPLERAFRAWRAALAQSEAGELVRRARAPAAPRPGCAVEELAWAERSFAAVELALAERLGAPALRAAWNAEHAALADAELASAGADPRAWRALERRHPCTEAAARAALRAHDEAAERGARDAAQAALARARLHLGDAATPAWSAAFAAREGAPAVDGARAALADGLTGVAVEEQWPWSSALDLRPREGTRVRAGAARVADDPAGETLWLQGAAELWRVRRGVAPERRDLEALCTTAGVPIGAAHADRAADWPLVPAADRRTLALVHGRAGATLDNALLVFDAGDVGLAWGLWAGGRFGPRAAAGASASEGRIEFQPGPCLSDELVVVQVRRWPALAAGEAPDSGRIESWLWALARADGAPVWERLLARGAAHEAHANQPNLGIAVLAPPAPPLSGRAGHVWAATGLGTLSQIDAGSGSGLRALLVPRWRADETAGDGAALGRTEDGALVLGLHESPVLETVAPEALRPLRPGLPRAGRTWLGGRAERALFRAPDGRGWEEWDGTRRLAASLDPGRGDRALPTGLVGRERALLASERALWLLDRTRQLALLARVELGPGASGELVLAHGALWVLGSERVTRCTLR